jgi:hypothetical protein
MCFLTVLVLLNSFFYPVNFRINLDEKSNNHKENTYTQKNDNYSALNVENEEVEEVEEIENRSDENLDVFSNFHFTPTNNIFIFEKIELNAESSIQFYSQNRSSITSKIWMESVQILI